MKTIVLLSALVLFALPAGPAFAVPRCDGPDLNATNAQGRPMVDEAALAADYEMQLRSAGIHGHNTRFWNGCLQTFVKIDGHDMMKFYDPNTLQEVPVN